MMLPSRSARAAVVAGLLAAGIGPVTRVHAEDRHVGGRTVAEQLCSQCHVIGREPQAGEFAGPAFLRVANMTSTTALSLDVFLQSHHQRMPSLRLDRHEMDAVIDYILSLKTVPPSD
ncbi:c-type cytochrome [Methylobacterium sp. P5_C11]